MAVVAKGVFTLPVTLSGFGQASDGQQVGGAGERWLVATNSPNDGLWVTQAGPWVRAPELDESSDFVWGNDNTVVRVRGGNEWGNSEWGYNGVDNPTIGLDTLHFAVRLKYYDPATATELTSYMEGLGLYYVDDDTVGLSPGRAYVPGLGKMLTAAANQTWPVPASTSGLYYAYVEEYPAGSGLGRLRITTTAPGEPYLGSARTQGDDETVRYLGIVRRSGSLVLPFADEVLGGSSVFRLYGGSSGFREVVTNSTSTTTAAKEIGPAATDVVDRLVGPGAQSAYLQAVLQSTTTSKANAYLLTSFGGLGEFATHEFHSPPGSGNEGSGRAFARLDEDQAFQYKIGSAGGGNLDVAVLGYYESR